MNLIIQGWILEQILWQGELLRHAEAQMLFLLCSGMAVGKFFCPKYKILPRCQI